MGGGPLPQEPQPRPFSEFAKNYFTSQETCVEASLVAANSLSVSALCGCTLRRRIHRQYAANGWLRCRL